MTWLLFTKKESGRIPPNIAEIYKSVMDPPGCKIVTDALFSAARRLRDERPFAQKRTFYDHSEKTNTPTIFIRFSTIQKMMDAAWQLVNAWRVIYCDVHFDHDEIVAHFLSLITSDVFGDIQAEFYFTNVTKPGRQSACIAMGAETNFSVYARGFNGCMRCETEPRKISICSKCLDVGYCSRECQKAAWPDHKSQCKSMCGFVDSIMGMIRV